MDTLYALRYNAWAVSASKVRNDERERFSSEIMSHLDHLYRFAFYLVKNEDEAQDCVQEACARALSSYRQFTPGTNMKAWLTRILHNFFCDTYQRSKRIVSIDARSDGAEDKESYWQHVPIDNPGPEKQFLRQELGQQIRNALKSVPEEFCAPILLVDLGEFTYAQAAEILSCPVGTVRSRLSRGRKLMQIALGKYAGKEESGS
jgi:RNA polymerase sigma-70 factor (ECF subfamily)